MSRTWALVAALAAVALAGCSEDAESASSTPACDLETHFLDASGACVAHVEPSIVLEGFPSQAQQYMTQTFTWSLDNGTRGTSAEPVHSMDSRLLGSLEDTPVTNETGPDDWGEEIAREQHKNFPNGPFEASFRWDEMGTVYVKGYMLIDGKNVWQDIGTVEVAQVQPTGEVENITITQGPPPELSESQTGITVGAGVQWTNENALYGYTIEFDCGGLAVDPVTVPAAGTSEAVTFLEPANCDYTATTDATAAGVTQADLAGKININTP